MSHMCEELTVKIAFVLEWTDIKLQMLLVFINYNTSNQHFQLWTPNQVIYKLRTLYSVALSCKWPNIFKGTLELFALILFVLFCFFNTYFTWGIFKQNLYIFHEIYKFYKIFKFFVKKCINFLEDTPKWGEIHIEETEEYKQDQR